MANGKTFTVTEQLNSEEDYDALQEVTAELEQAEARIEELEAKLAKAREEGFWVGRSCGGAKKEIDTALAKLLKGQDDAE